MKRVLVLGAGLVAKPLVDYLAESEGSELTVVDIVPARAEALAAGHENAAAVGLDVNDAGALSALVRNHDCVVSLLPASEHPGVARLCLEHGKHMSTASYVGPAMKDMGAEAAAKGLTFVNECGVDPGMDHMSAMRIIHDAHSRGGRVIEFRSYCGGLPAPEADTNPIGYKFSWEPRGALRAAVSKARYLRDGRVVEVPGDERVRSTLVEYGIPGGDSAMARTVGLPLAIATRMTLDGEIRRRGVVTPVEPEMYDPILDELDGLGLAFDESVH